MPGLVQLHRDWAARGVRVVAVSIDLAEPNDVRTAEELGRFVEQRGFALPVLAFDGDWGALTDRYALPGGPPSTLLLGPGGKELGRIEGAAEESELAALIEGALPR